MIILFCFMSINTPLEYELFDRSDHKKQIIENQNKYFFCLIILNLVMLLGFMVCFLCLFVFLHKIEQKLTPVINKINDEMPKFNKAVHSVNDITGQIFEFELFIEQMLIILQNLSPEKSF